MIKYQRNGYLFTMLISMFMVLFLCMGVAKAANEEGSSNCCCCCKSPPSGEEEPLWMTEKYQAPSDQRMNEGCKDKLSECCKSTGKCVKGCAECTAHAVAECCSNLNHCCGACCRATGTCIEACAKSCDKCDVGSC